MTQSEALEILYRAIPYSNQIKNLDLSKPDWIYFTWRHEKFKLSCRVMSIDKVDGMILSHDNTSILMTELLSKVRIEA